MEATTTFTQAVEIFNTAHKRFRGKPIIYDGDVRDKIGVNIAHMYWMDAFELVLKAMGHWYVENQDFVRVYNLSKTAAAKSDAAPVKAKEAMTTRAKCRSARCSRGQ
jgi:hypothetical protein